MARVMRDERHIGAIRVEAVQAVRVWVDMAAPVIAAVHGVAVGGGFQLLARRRPPGRRARCAARDVRDQVGDRPRHVRHAVAPRLVGPNVAKDLMFTGGWVTGTEAHSLGLVTRFADDPRTTTLELARDTAGRNPEAIKVMKRLVDASWTLSFDDSVREERDQTEGMIGSKNQLEAVVANLEPRPGRFDD